MDNPSQTYGLSYADAFLVLLLQAADNERGAALFGKSVAHARKELQPFMVGNDFPDVYFEFPLVGSPFLDVTVIYSDLEPGTQIDSPAAADTAKVLDWFAREAQGVGDVSLGFEIDAKGPHTPAAALHFQPRTHLELVEPFCKVVGAPEQAELYLNQAKRMPSGWPLSYFGMFRGRPNAPLRTCGYLDENEKIECAKSPQHLAHAFDKIGFFAYDNNMLQMVCAFMSSAPGPLDFQFDLLPDGTLGSTIGIEAQFDIKQPKDVRKSFENGPAAKAMSLLEQWGTADERWRMGAQSALAQAVPIASDNDTVRRHYFALFPRWAKARWANCAPQPSKLYLMGEYGIL